MAVNMKKLDYCGILKTVYSLKRPRGSSPPPCNYLGPYNKLGDSIMITSVPMKAFIEGKDAGLSFILENDKTTFIWEVLKHNPFTSNIRVVDKQPTTFHQLVEGYNCGNGNMLQQIYRSLGLKVDAKPKGFLNVYNVNKKANKIGIHIDGVSAGKMVGGGDRRLIYPHNVELLQEFILENSGAYEFVQFGLGNLLNGVVDFTKRDLWESFEELSSCMYMICINSGFYHAAIALDVKTICIINNPRISECFLPILVNEMCPCVPPYDVWDKNWLYPQAVHLHQDGANPLVPYFSKESLKAAIEGEVYPFWMDDYLYLIYDKL